MKINVTEELRKQATKALIDTVKENSVELVKILMKVELDVTAKDNYPILIKKII